MAQFEHLASQEVNTFATCWQLKLKSGISLGFTDHDSDLTIGTTTYQASTGITPSAITSSQGTKIDHLEIKGILESEFISEEDIESGKFDNAEIRVLIVDYLNPKKKPIKIKRGTIAEIKRYNGKFVAEVRGLTSALDKSLCKSYSPSCKARLGDSECMVRLQEYTKAYKIKEIVSKEHILTDNAHPKKGYYSHGFIEFMDGNNKGLTYDVKLSYENNIILYTPLKYQAKTGDKVRLIAGCDKRFSSCCKKFNNAINFRGEPHVPLPENLI